MITSPGGFSTTPTFAQHIAGGQGGLGLNNSPGTQGQGPFALFAGTFSPPQAPAIVGCVEVHGAAVVGAVVKLKQKGPAQSTTTGSNGCYKFDSPSSGQSGSLTIELPALP